MPSPLDPGEKLHIPLNLAQFFDLSVPGDYQLSPSWTYTPQGSTTKKAITLPGPTLKAIMEPAINNH